MTEPEKHKEPFFGFHKERFSWTVWVGDLTLNLWTTSCGDHRPFLSVKRKPFNIEGQIRTGRNRDLVFNLFFLKSPEDLDYDYDWEDVIDFDPTAMRIDLEKKIAEGEHDC